MTGSRDSTVGIATGYGLDDRGIGVRVLVKSRISSPPRRPDRFWGPPSLLPITYRGLFPGGLSVLGVKLTSHLHLYRGKESVDLYIHSPIRLHGLVLN
jgi:hypothetical protein